MPFGDLDRLGVRSSPGDGDTAPGLPGLLPELGVVGHLKIQPRARGVGDKGLVEYSAGQLQKLDLDAQGDHEQGVKDTARVEVRDDKARVLQPSDRLFLQIFQLWDWDDLVQNLMVNHAVATSTSTAPMIRSSCRTPDSPENWKEQRRRSRSSS